MVISVVICANLTSDLYQLRCYRYGERDHCNLDKSGLAFQASVGSRWLIGLANFLF